MPGATPSRIRVLLVDDDRLLGRLVAEALGSHAGLDVVGVCLNGEQAVASVLADPPDIVVMDLDMPGMDGAEATRRIRAAGVSTRIIALTNLEDDVAVTRVLAAGGHGCLAKGGATSLIVDAIALVARHGVTVLPEDAGRWLGTRLAAAARHRLSDRQLRVLKLIAAGEDREAIMTAEHISASTFKSDLRLLRQELGARGAVQLVKEAERLGLV